jgi:hypothetical protein
MFERKFMLVDQGCVLVQELEEVVLGFRLEDVVIWGIIEAGKQNIEPSSGPAVVESSQVVNRASLFRVDVHAILWH